MRESQENQEEAISPLMTYPWKSHSIISIVFYQSSSRKVNPDSTKGDIDPNSVRGPSENLQADSEPVSGLLARFRKK